MIDVTNNTNEQPTNILEVSANKDGHYIVRLFGTDSDITDLVNKGIPTVTLYGTEYTIQVDDDIIDVDHDIVLDEPVIVEEKPKRKTKKE